MGALADSMRYSPFELIKPSKADLEKQAAERTENAVQGLIRRAKELYSLYTEFGVKYQGMSAATRRLLAVNAHTTDNQVRQIVYAKFLLAAIMEWAPSNHRFSIQAFLDADGPVYKTDTTNELCPYWESFFVDVYETVTLLEGVMSEPQAAWDTNLLEHISSLLQGAEIKAGWVESLLKTVENSTSIPGFAMPKAEWEVYRTWNHFCLNIGNGVAVTDAALRFRKNDNTLHKYPLPTPLKEATRLRIWLPFEMDDKPWMIHAQAIVQQPNHLVPEPEFNNEHALEPHYWMLQKTTDINVCHHACSLVSHCCCRLHISCPTNSPCRIWGPNDCPHIRAGATSCDNKHCKMVDWMKYNLCLQPGVAWAPTFVSTTPTPEPERYMDLRNRSILGNFEAMVRPMMA